MDNNWIQILGLTSEKHEGTAVHVQVHLTKRKKDDGECDRMVHGKQIMDCFSPEIVIIVAARLHSRVSLYYCGKNGSCDLQLDRRPILIEHLLLNFFRKRSNHIRTPETRNHKQTEHR